jgi:hypothetical protein
LESTVDDFRSGRKRHIDAVTAILQELESEPLLSEQEKDATFRLYSLEINSIEARSGPRAVESEPQLNPGEASGDLPIVTMSKDKGKALPSSETPFGEPFDLLEQLSK